MNWKSLFRPSNADPAEFTRQFVAAVIEQLPAAQVTVPAPLTVDVRLAHGGVVRVNLDHDWQHCRNEPARWKEAFERSILHLQELERSPSPNAEQIVPLIREQAFLDQVSRSAPTGRAALKAEHLVSDLWIVYAFDSPHNLQYVRGNHPAEFPELRQQAIENLKRKLPAVARYDNGPAYMLSAGGVFEASLLLLDDVWQEMAKVVDGDIVATVPTRYVIFFTGSNSGPGLQQIKESAQDAWAQGPDPLSRVLLVRRHGQWEEWRESGP